MNKTSKPKVMFFDIETSGNIVYCFQIGRKVSINPEQILEEKKIICICYKYAGQKTVHHIQWDSETNDKKMIGEFGKLLNEVDIAIGHNGDNFDIKTLKGRGLFHRLPPMTNIATIDTLKLARANFRLNSNKLDYMATYLGHAGKMATGGLKLWLDIHAGSKKALKHMVDYCKQDVLALENVFNTILPYVDRLPVSMSMLYQGHREGCLSCGSPRVHRNGTRATKVGFKARMRCGDCGTNWTDTRILKKTENTT